MLLDTVWRGISHRRANGAQTPDEQAIREEILAGLVSDKGGAAQISTAMRVLAEVIASDAAWLVAVNRAIDGRHGIEREGSQQS